MANKRILIRKNCVNFEKALTCFREEFLFMAQPNLHSQTLIIPEKLGVKIKELRLELGLSQTELCDDFINLRTLQKIEKGETTPTFEVLLHISNKLQIEMFDLILSSRAPYYHKHQLPTILDFIVTDFENDGSIPEKTLKEVQTILEEFTDVKLPYVNAKQIETIYAIFTAFMHKNRQAAINILSAQIESMKLTEDSAPSDIQTFSISAYIRIVKDQKLLDEFLDKLRQFPQYIFHPTIAYNINIVYYRNKDWKAIESLSRNVLNRLTVEMPNTMIPYIYCQVGVALHYLHDATAAKIYDAGLTMLLAMRQYENFELMVQQAKKDNVPITVTSSNGLFF